MATKSEIIVDAAKGLELAAHWLLTAAQELDKLGAPASEIPWTTIAERAALMREHAGMPEWWYERPFLFDLSPHVCQPYTAGWFVACSICHNEIPAPVEHARCQECGAFKEAHGPWGMHAFLPR